jgi:hypothetical protein
MVGKVVVPVRLSPFPCQPFSVVFPDRILANAFTEDQGSGAAAFVPHCRSRRCSVEWPGHAPSEKSDDNAEGRGQSRSLRFC